MKTHTQTKNNNTECNSIELNQSRMPFVEALEAYKDEHFVPFHTPGHKIGNGAPATLKAWMDSALPYDLGVMYALDDLHEPEGCLKEAQDLAAQLYGADHTWFSINGTTALIETMIMGTVGTGDTIIIPREAHRSVMGGLILSGAKPVYLEGRFDERWGVPLGTTPEEVEATLNEHPEAKAIVLVNPNYYGIAIDLETIVSLAHKRGVIVLVDEAHGAHLPFGKNLPKSALACGADLVAQSTHKLIGSLTQTSMLHGQGTLINERRITQVHQILQSTSPNYIFLAGLDMARHQMAMEGHKLVTRAEQLAQELRQNLRQIPGIKVPFADDFHGLYDYDATKVLIDFYELGLTGVEAEKRLRLEGIEVELVQAYHVLVLITIGDTETSIQRLITAVRKVASEMRGTPKESVQSMPLAIGTRLPQPEVVLTPRDAFYSKTRSVMLSEAIGKISGETISYYPPGIPFLSVGERITADILLYIKERQAMGFVPNGCADKTLETIRIISE